MNETLKLTNVMSVKKCVRHDSIQSASAFSCSNYYLFKPFVATKYFKLIPSRPFTVEPNKPVTNKSLHEFRITLLKNVSDSTGLIF